MSVEVEVEEGNEGVQGLQVSRDDYQSVVYVSLAECGPGDVRFVGNLPKVFLEGYC